MERRKRLSLGLAGGGVAAALAVAVLGGRTARPGGEVAAVSVEVEALIRETAAAVQARADTLAQLPRLGWAVATDEATVRDMTTEELAFRTRAGEHIEIAHQAKEGERELRRLLRLPADSSFLLPMSPGAHLVFHDGEAHVVSVVPVEPRQRAEELTGLIAVARVLDTAPLAGRLKARGVHVELRRGDVATAFGADRPPPGAAQAKAALISRVAAGAELVIAAPSRSGWARFLSLAVALLSLGGAATLWLRTATVDPIPRSAPSPDAVDEDSARESEWSEGVDTDPVVGRLPEVEASALPEGGAAALPAQAMHPSSNDPRRSGGAIGAAADLTHTGRVDLSPARPGPSSISDERPRARRPTLPPPFGTLEDPRTEEYRALFTEYLRLRHTTGEPDEEVDLNVFVETLKQKRAELVRELRVPDVRFRLAFDNGKAAIRYVVLGPKRG